MTRAWIALPLLALVACGGVPGQNRTIAGGAGRPAVGQPRVVAEASVTAAIGQGRPTVLLFMASGCSSCAAQAAALGEAARGHRGIRLVGVDVATDDDAAALRAFVTAAELQSLPIDWTLDAGDQLARRYGVQTLDEMVGLAGGAVRFHDPPTADAAQLRTQLASLT